MAHCKLCLVVPILLGLAVAGYYTVRPQSGWHGSCGAGSANLVDPMDKGEAVKFLHQPTRWQARGNDQSGRAWQGYLYVDKAPENYFRAGCFEWSTGSDSGRYHFNGTFDPATRAVKWTGYNIEERFGAVSMAIYEAELSADGKKLENGRWQGGISIPGTWTAEALED